MVQPIECVYEFAGEPPFYALSFNDDGIGLGLAWNGAYRSTDGGFTWARQDVSVSDAYDVAVGPSGDGVIVGVQIWHSDGEDDSWSVAEYPIIQACSAAVYVDSNRVMAAGRGNIVCSTDGGETWSYGKRETEEPLRAYSVSAPLPTFLVVGSRDGYLYSETGCMPTTSTDRNEEAPEGYNGELRLSPNPARDVLRIEARHEIERVFVHVLSSGKSVLSMDESIVSSNVVSMDVGSLPSGAYVVVVLTRNGIFTKYFIK